jgi:acetyltransferase-like isoleucine patch superfamily enzyme
MIFLKGKKMIKQYRSIKKKVKFFLKVNWIKTIYFNFKKFPFSIAKKLPVFFYGKVKFQNISGEIIIIAPVSRGMIGFGQPFEMNTIHKGTAEIALVGKLIFKGYVQFGKDYFIYVKKNAILEMGNMSSIASNGKIICTNSIIFGDYARIGSESQVIDTNFHQMIDVKTNEMFDISAPIKIGNYNFISNRVTILSKTTTPNFCTIASNSLCTKDYTAFGENILIGGVPAKLLKINISRDWEGESENMDIWLKV